jgi:hypothetical protein
MSNSRIRGIAPVWPTLLTFLVLSSTTGRPLARERTEAIARRAEERLFFVPDEHLHWTNAAATVAFLGWQAEAGFGGLRAHWHAGPGGLDAFSGWPLVKPSAGPQGGTRAEQIAGLVARRGLDAREALNGAYTVASLRAHGPGLVFADPFGTGRLYAGESDGVHAAGTRSSAVAAAVGCDRRDREALGWLPYFALVVGSGTGYDGVRLLPAEVSLELDGAGVARERSEPDPFANLEPAHDREALLDAVEADMLDNVRAAAAVPCERRTIRLSGGKDSRVLLALVVRAGVQEAFEFVTLGPEESPDVRVARELARRCGIELTREDADEAALTAEELEERVRAHAFQTDGLLSPWTLKGATAAEDVLTVSGNFGEVMRANYVNDRRVDSPDELRRFFRDGMRFDDARLMRQAARERYQAAAQRWVEGHLERGVACTDVVDVFFTRERLRGFWGVAEEVNGLSPQAAPLQSVAALHAAFRLGQEERRADGLRFELVRRTAEHLLRVPLADVPWSEGALSRLADGHRYRHAPVTLPAGTSNRVPWQAGSFDAFRPLFRRRLLEDRESPVNELLDPERLDHALSPGTRLSFYALDGLYGALGAAVWLAGDETPARYAPAASNRTTPPTSTSRAWPRWTRRSVWPRTSDSVR